MLYVNETNTLWEPSSVLSNFQKNILIIIMDIIHHPVFYLKHNVSETEFCLFSGGTHSFEPNQQS
jgi:hypothetical protein